MVVSWFFRWGEHAIFAVDMAKYFGVWKTVISIMSGLLTALAGWREQPRPFWIVLSGLIGFAVTLVIINAVWGLFNKWKISKTLAGTASAATDIDDSLAHSTLPLRVEKDQNKERQK
jgi:hypothetical protein